MWWRLSRRKSKHHPVDKPCDTTDRLGSSPARLQLGIASGTQRQYRLNATTTVAVAIPLAHHEPNVTTVRNNIPRAMNRSNTPITRTTLADGCHEPTSHGTDNTTSTKDMSDGQASDNLNTSTIPSENAPHYLDIIGNFDTSMSFTTSMTAALQAVTLASDSTDSPARIPDAAPSNMSSSLSQNPEDCGSDALVPVTPNITSNDDWMHFLSVTPFLAVPPEIHFKIISFLHPIDATCLSLANRYMYKLDPPYHHRFPLDIGGPFSSQPYETPPGCRFCCPVLYHPAHCELSYHLRPFIPKHLTFCAGRCQKYTRCEQEGYSDSNEFCGECGINYRRRYERGRRYLDRPGEKRLSSNQWFNSARKL